MKADVDSADVQDTSICELTWVRLCAFLLVLNFTVDFVDYTLNVNTFSCFNIQAKLLSLV